jgi:hypothetical protein
MYYNVRLLRKRSSLVVVDSRYDVVGESHEPVTSTSNIQSGPSRFTATNQTRRLTARPRLLYILRELQKRYQMALARDPVETFDSYTFFQLRKTLETF